MRTHVYGVILCVSFVSGHLRGTQIAHQKITSDVLVPSLELHNNNGEVHAYVKAFSSLITMNNGEIYHTGDLGGVIHRSALSPNGLYAAAASVQNNKLKIWNTLTGQELLSKTFPPDFLINHVQVNDTGDLVVHSNSDSTGTKKQFFTLSIQ